jgi:hypothetical protein
MGTEYQGTAPFTLFNLNEDDVDFWNETLQKE